MFVTDPRDSHPAVLSAKHNLARANRWLRRTTLKAAGRERWAYLKARRAEAEGELDDAYTEAKRDMKAKRR